MKADINLTSLTNGLTSFIKRFHSILFFLLVSGGLFAAILMLLAIINLSSTTATTSSQAVNGSFDDDTIRRLKEGAANQATPGPRPSPFVE